MTHPYGLYAPEQSVLANSRFAESYARGIANVQFV